MKLEVGDDMVNSFPWLRRLAVDILVSFYFHICVNEYSLH